MQQKCILVVDDQAEVANVCRRALEKEGYQVLVACNSEEAMQHCRRDRPDLVIMDIVMPEMDGIELCQLLRTALGLSGLPFLFLSGKHDITDKAAAYGVGADDYLTKPFDVRELTMRVRALLRRTKPSWGDTKPRELTVGDLRLDCRAFRLTTPQKTVALTPVEFDLLYYLMSYPGEVQPSDKLLQNVWGYPPGTRSDVVRTHMKNLRDKIESAGSPPRHIRTVGHHGYMISAEPEQWRA